jgi:hypothetical protein
LACRTRRLQEYLYKKVPGSTKPLRQVCLEEKRDLWESVGGGIEAQTRLAPEVLGDVVWIIL